jgi:hypothetical protein
MPFAEEGNVFLVGDERQVQRPWLHLAELDALRDQLFIVALVDDYGHTRTDRKLCDRKRGRDVDAQVAAEDDDARRDRLQATDDNRVGHGAGRIAQWP